MAGPRLRTDVVDVYVVKRADSDLPGEHAAPAAMSWGSWLVLQCQRAGSGELCGTWQPVMGHVQEGERATNTMAREAKEELGLDVRGSEAVGVWQLEQVMPFYVASNDCVYLSPRFVVQVVSSWNPRLNHEHSSHRWVGLSSEKQLFMWPGQHQALTEIEHILNPQTLANHWLRV
jgi:8-oxo-dGTP pyrophosphatase MutT (NUDIX family)